MFKTASLFVLLLVSCITNAQKRSFDDFYDSLKAAAAPFKTYRLEWVRDDRFFDYPARPDFPNTVKKVFNFLRAKKEVVEAPDFIFRVVVHAHDITPFQTLFAGIDGHTDYFNVSASYQLDVYIEIVPKKGKAFRPALVENYVMNVTYKMGIQDRNRMSLFGADPTKPIYGSTSLEQNLYGLEIGIRERSPFFKQVEELLIRFQRKGSF